MNEILEMSLTHLRVTRDNIRRVMDSLTIEQINKIPDGFSNNIIWNAGHVLVTQQLLQYGRSGLSFKVGDEMIANYRKGTRPDGFVDGEEVSQIYGLLGSTIEDLANDLRQGVFGQYQSYSTSFGVTLRSIEDAVIFNPIHEGMHLGYILSIRKLI